MVPVNRRWLRVGGVGVLVALTAAFALGLIAYNQRRSLANIKAVVCDNQAVLPASARGRVVNSTVAKRLVRLCGARGVKGERGTEGSAGIAGVPGRPGRAGRAGHTGARGIAGHTGARGPAGSPGRTGRTGAQGPPGARGPQGPPGPSGSAAAVQELQQTVDRLQTEVSRLCQQLHLCR